MTFRRPAFPRISSLDQERRRDFGDLEKPRREAALARNRRMGYNRGDLYFHPDVFRRCRMATLILLPGQSPGRQFTCDGDTTPSADSTIARSVWMRRRQSSHARINAPAAATLSRISAPLTAPSSTGRASSASTAA